VRTTRMPDLLGVPLHLQKMQCCIAARINRAIVAFLQRYQWHKYH